MTNLSPVLFQPPGIPSATEISVPPQEEGQGDFIGELRDALGLQLAAGDTEKHSIEEDSSSQEEVPADNLIVQILPEAMLLALPAAAKIAWGDAPSTLPDSVVISETASVTSFVPIVDRPLSQDSVQTAETASSVKQVVVSELASSLTNDTTETLATDNSSKQIAQFLELQRHEEPAAVAEKDVVPLSVMRSLPVEIGTVDQSSVINSQTKLSTAEVSHLTEAVGLPTSTAIPAPIQLSELTPIKTDIEPIDPETPFKSPLDLTDSLPDVAPAMQPVRISTGREIESVPVDALRSPESGDSIRRESVIPSQADFVSAQAIKTEKILQPSPPVLEVNAPSDAPVVAATEQSSQSLSEVSESPEALDFLMNVQVLESTPAQSKEESGVQQTMTHVATKFSQEQDLRNVGSPIADKEPSLSKSETKEAVVVESEGLVATVGPDSQDAQTSFTSTMLGQTHGQNVPHHSREFFVPTRTPAAIEPHQVRLDTGEVKVEIMRLAQQGGGQVVMELTPPDQSKFRIDLIIDSQGLASLIVEGASDSTRSRLEQGAESLQRQFAEMGLSLQLDMRQSHDPAAQREAMQLLQATTQAGGANLRSVDQVPTNAQRTRVLVDNQVHLYA